MGILLHDLFTEIMAKSRQLLLETRIVENAGCQNGSGTNDVLLGLEQTILIGTHVSTRNAMDAMSVRVKDDTSTPMLGKEGKVGGARAIRGTSDIAKHSCRRTPCEVIKIDFASPDS